MIRRYFIFNSGFFNHMMIHIKYISIYIFEVNTYCFIEKNSEFGIEISWSINIRLLDCYIFRETTASGSPCTTISETNVGA